MATARSYRSMAVPTRQVGKSILQSSAATGFEASLAARFSTRERDPSIPLPDLSFSRYTPPGQIPNEDAPSLLWTGMDHDPRGAPPQMGVDGLVAPAGLFAGLAMNPGPMPNALAG